MAAGRKPGSVRTNHPVDIDDGTTCLAVSPTPGPLSSDSVILVRVAKPVSRMTHEEMSDADNANLAQRYLRDT
jgi:hypothetical protein